MTKKIAREVTDRDIGWFAGIIAGEGSVTFGKTKSTTNRIYYGIHIVNTNKKMLERCLEIIDYISQEPNKLKLKPKVYRNGTMFSKQPLQCYQITIRRKESIRKVLEEIIDLLTEKQDKAQRLLYYLQTVPPLTRLSIEEIDWFVSGTPVETKREALRKEMKR